MAVCMNGELPEYLQRVVYSPSQLKHYYERISLPPQHRHEPGAETDKVLKDPTAALDFLTALQRYHICAIPFENLDLHYSSHHTISIEPRHLFNKIVDRGCGRGGYCMENSGLFGVVLRSLGFEAYPTAARVNQAMEPVSASPNWPGPRYNGWNHMVHLVLIGNERYMVDVGVGTIGPTRPLRLTDASGEGESIQNIGRQHMRLRRSTLPDTLYKGARTQPLWIYEIQNDPEHNGPWTTCYCFGELEFLPADFEIMNFFTSTSRTSFFTREVLCSKYVMNEQGEIEGTVGLVGRNFKRRIFGEGKTESTEECKSESDRVSILEQKLGVRLLDEEKAGIVGLGTAL